MIGHYLVLLYTWSTLYGHNKPPSRHHLSLWWDWTLNFLRGQHMFHTLNGCLGCVQAGRAESMGLLCRQQLLLPADTKEHLSDTLSPAVTAMVSGISQSSITPCYAPLFEHFLRHFFLSQHANAHAHKQTQLVLLYSSDVIRVWLW